MDDPADADRRGMAVTPTGLQLTSSASRASASSSPPQSRVMTIASDEKPGSSQQETPRFAAPEEPSMRERHNPDSDDPEAAADRQAGRSAEDVANERRPVTEVRLGGRGPRPDG